MKQITHNRATALSAAVRYEQIDGEPYLVAPCSLLVPGVLNGSGGPLLYPPEEVAKTVEQWDNIPLTLNHPVRSGLPASASDPDMKSKHWIGIVRHPRMDGQRLRGEAWFHVPTTEKKDPRILNWLRSKRMIEVSTGIVTETQPAEEGAELNGQPYEQITKNIRADHLAVLPDDEGACSIKDGCGIFNHQADRSDKQMAYTETERNEKIDALIANSCCWEESDRDALNAVSDALLDRFVENEERESEELKRIDSIMERYNEKVTANAETHEEKPEVVDPTPMTAEEWMDAAPQEIKELVANHKRIVDERKGEIIAKLTANIKDEDAKTAKAEQLANKSLDDLELMESLIAEERENPQPGAVDFRGRAPIPSDKVYNAEGRKPIPLVPASIDFTK